MLPILAQIALPLLPLLPDSFKIGVVGDNQINAYSTFDGICRDMRAQGISLWVGLGDHVQNHGLPGEWQQLFDAPMLQLAGVPRLGALGNHDDILGYSQHVWQIPQHPLTSQYGNAIGCWGAVTWGPVRFVFLDTNEDPAIRISLQAGGAQATWFTNELASRAWTGARWRIVCFHQPAATELWAGCFYPTLGERRWIMDATALASGSAILNGHAHAYQRGSWRGVPWIISGGGGGWLDTTRCADVPEITVAQAVWHWVQLEVTPDALTVTARNLQGQVFDTVRIQ